MGKRPRSSAVVRVAYRPIGLLAGIVGGLLAGAVFKSLWRRVGREDNAPKATDADRGWVEIVLSAAAQGAVFGAVKSVVDRAGAEAFAHATGVWPGRERTRNTEYRSSFASARNVECLTLHGGCLDYGSQV